MPPPLFRVFSLRSLPPLLAVAKPAREGARARDGSMFVLRAGFPEQTRRFGCSKELAAPRREQRAIFGRISSTLHWRAAPVALEGDFGSGLRYKAADSGPGCRLSGPAQLRARRAGKIPWRRTQKTAGRKTCYRRRQVPHRNRRGNGGPPWVTRSNSTRRDSCSPGRDPKRRSRPSGCGYGRRSPASA